MLTKDHAVWIIDRETGGRTDFKIPAHVEVEYSGKLLSAKPSNQKRYFNQVLSIYLSNDAKTVFIIMSKKIPQKRK